MGSIQILEWAVCCNLQVVALNPGLCPYTFPKPRVSPPLPPALVGGAGPQSEECKLGGPAFGAHSRRDPRAQRQVCATRRSAKAGSRGGHPHQISTSSPLGADWLEGKPRGWQCASQSPSPETQRAGKGCLRGAEHREPEGR